MWISCDCIIKWLFVSWLYINDKPDQYHSHYTNYYLYMSSCFSSTFVCLDKREMRMAGFSCVDKILVPYAEQQPVSTRSVRFVSPPPQTSHQHILHSSTDLSAPRRLSVDSDTAFSASVPRRLSIDSDIDTSTQTLNLSDDESDDELKGRIPKPPGEAGRPNRGGYSLEQELVNKHKWPKSRYTQVLVSYSFPFLGIWSRISRFIYRDISSNLSIISLIVRCASWTNHLTSWKPFASRCVHHSFSCWRGPKAQFFQAAMKFKFIAAFHRLWVVDDFIKSRVKSRKTSIRLQTDAALAAETRATTRRLTIRVPPAGKKLDG